ncbi:MAG: hypothetical protein A2148_12205 [Chloroflexi bacterium RBG_16_68_14]|nr:MAG: hypothetical protein A2148_12205 [Chloroflexi bacterium RBG_16_68_14]
MSELLLVEATEELQTLAEELERAGFHATTCSLAEAADHLARGELVDVVLLNLMGEIDDTALRRLLGADSFPPRTVALALVRSQRVAKLDPALPVDDFLVFPAPPEELLARIRRAAQRRARAEPPHLLRCGDLTIDQASYKVYIGNRPVELTYKEYELLRFLALNQGTVCTRQMLLSRVWGYDFYGGARTVDVHIRRLRSKIEDGAHTFIETVRNVGYRFHIN